MVCFFNVYRFTEQMVDTIEDLIAIAVTNHNRLLIAQSDYTIEVRDLLSENKTPLFSFPTVDKVQNLTHCASGNYVATLEGKQTFQKSDVLIARVYTNWEADFIVNECKKSTKFVKRFMRARIAGVVTPSSAKADEDYLDMIEIPVSYSSATLITCCQKTGRLLIASSSTVYLFQKVYLRGHNGKSPLFMDFVPLAQIFQLTFAPLSVTISENIITAYNNRMVSVFRLKKAGNANESKAVCPNEETPPSIFEDTEFETSLEQDTKVITEKGALHVNNIIFALKHTDESKSLRALKNVLSSNSFPITVHLKGINDVVINQKRKPFVVLPPKPHCEIKNGKVEDNFVETHSSNKEIGVMAESLLALHLSDPEEIIAKTALQVLTRDSSSQSTFGSDSHVEQFCVGSKQFVCLNFLVTSGNEGYLFHLDADRLQEGLRYVAFLNFTSTVINVIFESFYLHVLTKIGVETYCIPTLRPILFNEEPVLAKCTEWTSLLGLTPFMGVLDFACSKDCLTVFSSSSNEKKGKESLPWTVYSLKLPQTFETFKEMEEKSLVYDIEKNNFQRCLRTEAYLTMQMSLNFGLPVTQKDNLVVALNHFTNSTKTLIKLYFKSKNIEDTKNGISIALASNIDPIEIIKELDNGDKSFNPHIIYFLSKWISKNYDAISPSAAEWIIRFLEENHEFCKLSKFVLLNENTCRTEGHLAVPCLKRYINNSTRVPDVYVVFALCVLYTQQCLQNEVREILDLINKQNEQFKDSFIAVTIKNWKFLFENITANNEEQMDFSELTTGLMENFPNEISEILIQLVKKKIFILADVVQMLLRQIPCQVSMEKGHFVLQTFLEGVFSQKILTNMNDPGVNNCLKILMRSYLTQLRSKALNNNAAQVSHEPIFSVQLPEFVTFLPLIENCNYVALRKLQDLVWSKMLNEESIKEIIEALPIVELKLNVLAMLGGFDFIKELMKSNQISAIFPYAKVIITGVKKWRDFIILIQNRITEQKDAEENYSEYEEIYDQTLEHLSQVMTPSQLNAVLEPIISKKDDMYWKHIMKAQQISYANDVKELIMNTSQQLLYSNSLY